MRVPAAAEHHHGDAGGEQQAVPADRLRFALEARHQVGDGNVEEARGGDGDDVGNPVAGVVEGEIADDAAGYRGQASGKSMTTTKPPSVRLLALTEPRCASTTRRVIAKPSP